MFLKDLGWFILKGNPIINLWAKYCTDFDTLNKKQYISFKNRIQELDFYKKHDSNDYIDKHLAKDDFELLTKDYQLPSTTGYTSGTTNFPLKVKRSIYSIIIDEACLKKHWYEQGVPLNPKIAILRGDVIAESSLIKKQYWKYLPLSRRLIMSSFNLSNDTIGLYLNKLEEFKPDIILAYPSSITSLSKLALSASWHPNWDLKGVFTSGEQFLTTDRRVCEKVFSRVFDHYGSAERVARLQQCRFGNYHLKNGYAKIDFLKSDKKYEIIGTGYRNLAMPLSNYRTGDFVNELPSDESCECGLSSPYIHSIEGRESGVLTSVGGKTIPYAGLCQIVWQIDGLAEAQYAQTSETDLEVRYTTYTGKSSPELEQTFRYHIEKNIGREFELNFKFCEALIRNKSGKLAGVVVEYD